MNYGLWLHCLPGIGGIKIHQLLQHFGTAEGVYYGYQKELEDIQGINKKDIDNILYRRNWDKLKRLEQEMIDKKITFICSENACYPEQLRNIYDAPYGLFFRGRLPTEKEMVLGMVGARMCSPYGKSVALQLAGELARQGVSIISGMARGIDGYSHEGCLKAGGVTYGVLAGGVDVIYPVEHRKLYEEILERGGIISEYPPGTQPRPGMFPQRNRIISGLSNGIVLVEAKKRSGSLITADYALEQGKDVYVVPGRITDPLSIGTNGYIKQGASIIDSIQGFMEELNLADDLAHGHEKNKKILLEKEESMVYSCLRLSPCSINELMDETGLSLIQVIGSIGRLVEMGLAEEYYKNHYIRST